MRVHLGCGLTTPPGWVNVDGSWNARLAQWPRTRAFLGRVRLLPNDLTAVPWNRDILHHDLRKPLPWRDGSVSAIYTSHTLEHLYSEEVDALLKECYRVLAPDGVMRNVVPDLHHLASSYIKRAGDAGAADQFMSALLLRNKTPPPRKLLLRLYTATADFNSHKWMYDSPSLTARMRSAGFSDLKEMPYRESRIGDISDVELPDRVLNGAGLAVEGVKRAEA